MIVACGILVPRWEDIPQGKKAVLFDDVKSLYSYAAHFESSRESVRVRRIHPISIEWAKAFEVVVYLGKHYSLWESELSRRLTSYFYLP